MSSLSRLPRGASALLAAAFGITIALAAGDARAQAGSGGTLSILAEAETAFERDDFERAADLYDQALEIDPRTLTPEHYYKRVFIYLRDGKAKAGLTFLGQTGKRLYPRSPWIRRGEAILLAGDGRRKDAVAIAERVVETHPQFHDLQFLIGEYYFNFGPTRATRTIAAYQAYLKHRPDDEENRRRDKAIRTKIGFAYLHLKKGTEAAAELETALKLKGDTRFDPNARKGLCGAYTMIERWDAAITWCERVINDKLALRNDPSPFYNVGLAYLKRRNIDRALAAANTYIGLKPRQPNGYILRGQIYLAQRKWNLAEEQLLRADKLAPNNPQIATILGDVYRLQDPPQTGKAIQRLTVACAANPKDADCLASLAEVYLADGQATNAATQAQKGLALDPQNRRLLLLMADAAYEEGRPQVAFETYQKILAVDPNEARAKTGLVNAVNGRAAERFKKGDLAGAEKELQIALRYDAGSPTTNFNLGIVYLEQGKAKLALERLLVRARKTPDDVLTNRVLGSAYLALGDTASARAAYDKAKVKARELRNFPILCEIYTDLTPLLVKQGAKGIEEAVAELEQLASFAEKQPYEAATKRNLQLAYYHRGSLRLKQKNAAGAVADLERATREPQLLRGNEEAVFTFALGLAYVQASQEGKAREVFSKYAKKGVKIGWLKPPFDTIGPEMFLAYANYREGTMSSRMKATSTLEDLQGKASGKVALQIKDLLRSAWELVAYEHWAKGDLRQAEEALTKAETIAGSGADRKTIEHNRAVLAMDRSPPSAKAVFERLGGTPAEALINLGILFERQGDPRRAYEFWVQAKGKGAKAPGLDSWIESKKRIFNF